MIKKIVISLFGSLLTMSGSMLAQNAVQKQKFDYDARWNEVSAAEGNGLPQTAYDVSKKIFDAAKKEQNAEQMIKSLLHCMRFQQDIGTKEFYILMSQWERETQSTPFPASALMHSMLAKMYGDYYNSNQWTINQRTNTSSFVNDSIETWTSADFARKIILECSLSLKQAEALQKVSITQFQLVIYQGSESTAALRPTLYDFIVNQNIEYLRAYRVQLDKPTYAFELDNEALLLSAKEFVAINTESLDTLSFDLQSLRLYQQWLRFRMQDGNQSAQLFADAQRLEHYRNVSTAEQKDSSYLKTVRALMQANKGVSGCSYLAYLEAQFHNQQGEKYIANDASTHCFRGEHKLALELCQDAIKEFPSDYGSTLCRNLIVQIERKQLELLSEDVVAPNKNFALKVSFRSVANLYYRVLILPDSKLPKEWMGEAERIRYFLKHGTLVKQGNNKLPVSGDYATHSTEVVLDGLASGKYYVVYSETANFEPSNTMMGMMDLMVNPLAYILRNENEASSSLYVLDRTTGLGIKDAKIITYYQVYEKHEYRRKKHREYKTDENGFVTILSRIPDTYSFEVHISSKTDSLTFSTYNSNDYSYQRNYEEGTMFTDRAIYRPGQTVYYKGVAYNNSGDTAMLQKRSSVSVQLLDANEQQIGTQIVPTNDFGSYNGSFAIPQGVLNGVMTLSSGFASVNIQVEEYKRPKFSVALQQPKGIYSLGQTITVKGSATSFAGSALSDAAVKYTIERVVPYCRYWWYPQRASKIIAQGTLKTNAQGEIDLSFVAVPDKSLPHLPEVSFQYQIKVDVTDLNGETQSTETMLTIGYNTFTVNASVAKQQDIRLAMKLSVGAQNLNHQPINTKGVLRIYKLQDPQTALRDRRWESPDTTCYTAAEWNQHFAGNEYRRETKPEAMTRMQQVFEYTFAASPGAQTSIEDIAKWKTGWYAVVTEATDSAGNKNTITNYTVLYDSKSNILPHPQPFWFCVPKISFQPSETARILLGTSHSMRVLFEVERNGTLLRSEWLQLNNEQRVMEIPIVEADRGGLTVQLTAFYDNRIYTQTANFSIPWSNKDLKLKFETFRDKLQPGQQEQWKISIKGANNQKVAAEMLATLYDASLDEFVPHSFNAPNFFNYHYQRRAWQVIPFSTRNDNAYSFYNISYSSYSFTYNSLNWFDFYYRSYQRYRMMKSGMAKRSVDYAEEEMMESAAPPMPSAMAMDKVSVQGEAPEEAKKESANGGVAKDELQAVVSGGVQGEKQKAPAPIKARTNLSELAFFYPTLYTNDSGVVSVNFTIPEALTKWKMLGFAHTQDLSYGFIENTLQTQKELMVMPNPPRFLREGDSIEFPVKVSNLSDKNLKGIAQLQLFDAFTMKPLPQLLYQQTEKQNFSIAAKSNTVVMWHIAVPEGIEAITWRATADCETFADGEENTLPVLSNRMLVTETMPLAMSHKGTKTFVFEKLKNNTSTTLRSRTYTLEFTSNPAWYAVQALPYLIEYPYECAEQTFSRFYANSIATHIVNSSPRIKAVFDQWASQADGKALLSKLEKNQDLKSILLQETPWVMESQDQTERQKRVALLFDLNRMSNELQSAIKKLQDMQFSEGGWPWFKGMKSDRYITEHIVCGIAHLQKLKVVTKEQYPEIDEMLSKAVDFVDAEMEKDYREMLRHWSKKDIEENHLNWTDIHYLYTRSFFLKSQPVAKKHQAAYNYYLQQAEKYWLLHDRYAQGMIGLALHRAGKKPTVDKIISSMREFALHSEEMGMYWKENTGGWYWYQAPVETQALLIEFFADATRDTIAVNDMKLWLLKQKQTQDWQTTKATTEAIYALLLQGDNWLNNTELAKIQVGSQLIDPNKLEGSKPEAGTGYFRTSWSGSEITNDMGTITVTNPNTSPAWGAMYWQYFEQLDKITPHETPLRLSKKLFIEAQTNAGAVIRPLTDTSKLLVGDKIIVRIELRSDRDMEYVHMKDMRAAGFEPINVLSSYKWQAGLGYYESTKDASTNFFIDYLPKGTYVFEYPLRVAQRGNFSNGITTIQCMYAPEFASHSEGVRVEVKSEK